MTPMLGWSSRAGVLAAYRPSGRWSGG